MPVSYCSAGVVEEIADRLIPEHFPNLHESGVRIEYVFRSEAAKSGGKLCLGKARKVGGLNAILSMDSGPPEVWTAPADAAYFVIEVAADTWQRMSPKQQEALTFHELCHLVVEPGEEEKDAWTLKLRHHDLEAFADEVRFYGAWKADIQFFHQVTAEALSLPFDGQPAPA